MVEKKRVGVVFGGRSGEHEVSLASAASVIENLNRELYEVIPIAITQQGTWLWGVEPRQLIQAKNDPALLETLLHMPAVTLAVGDTSSQHLVPIQSTEPLANDGKLDVFFPVLHGPNGEDGTIQGLFEMANVPYVGCGVLASAIGMDKDIMKRIFHMAELPIVDALIFKRPAWERASEEILAAIEQRLSYPCFVKPANLGSSVGVSKARNRAELQDAVQLAFTYDRKIIVEQGLDVREFSCAVLGNDEPEVSVVGEILPGSEFSDYDDKYINHTIQFDIPTSRIPAEDALELQKMARRAYLALELNGLARVDFFLDKTSGKYFINEVNTLPGFTSQSLYPKLWAASGLAYPRLLERLIELGLQRYADQHHQRVSR